MIWIFAILSIWLGASLYVSNKKNKELTESYWEQRAITEMYLNAALADMPAKKFASQIIFRLSDNMNISDKNIRIILSSYGVDENIIHRLTNPKYDGYGDVISDYKAETSARKSIEACIERLREDSQKQSERAQEDFERNINSI